MTSLRTRKLVKHARFNVNALIMKLQQSKEAIYSKRTQDKFLIYQRTRKKPRD